ncbi:hypothetical protein KEM52_005910, partial [Ascosphaera acerosa]
MKPHSSSNCWSDEKDVARTDSDHVEAKSAAAPLRTITNAAVGTLAVSGRTARQSSGSPVVACDEEREGSAIATEQSQARVSCRSQSSLQYGVAEIEILTSVASRNHLIAAYVAIWVITSVDALQATMTTSLTPYVTSAFSAHSLTAVTSIVASLVGGISKIPLARIFDIWGRPRGFTLVIVILILGLVMMASCNGVKMYAAAQVFHMVGHNGYSYFCQIFIADTVPLESRAFVNALVISPFIITAWIGGPVVTALYHHSNWRWGFGMFAVILPVVCTPLWTIWGLGYREAVAKGLLTRSASQVSSTNDDESSTSSASDRKQRKYSILHATRRIIDEFDVVGLLLLCAGLSLFLLPFSIYTYQAAGWRSPLIICLIIFGGLSIIAFACWERWFAPKCFLQYSTLTNRTVVGACLFP